MRAEKKPQYFDIDENTIGCTWETSISVEEYNQIYADLRNEFGPSFYIHQTYKENSGVTGDKANGYDEDIIESERDNATNWFKNEYNFIITSGSSSGYEAEKYKTFSTYETFIKIKRQTKRPK